MPRPSPRLNPESGLAIGMILFIIAILAVLGTAISASGNFMGTTVTPDRVAADVKSQANLIRSKILECFMYGRANERGDLADLYPSSTGTGTNVVDLDCPSFASGQQNLWTGQSPASLPPPTNGFEVWVYKNAGAANGRCIRTQPTSGFVNDQGTRNGLSLLSSYFSNNERVYDSNSTSQRFILWITKPTGSAHIDCSS